MQGAVRLQDTDCRDPAQAAGRIAGGLFCGLPEMGCAPNIAVRNCNLLSYKAFA